VKIRKIHVYLTLVLLAFGFIVAYSVQFTKTMVLASTVSESELDKKQKLQEKNLDEKTKIHELETQLETLKQKVSNYEKKMGTPQDDGSELTQELEKVRMWVGLVPVTGTGLIVTLNDNKNVPDTGNVNDYIVHEENLRQVVNELFSAGAEAVSINGQRLTTDSSVRCVGPTILVNEVKTAPPFEISAIGNSDTLMKALQMPGGILNQLKEFSKIDVKLEKKDKIDLPAYAGDLQKNVHLQNIPSKKEESS
jgi:uncharacterized protein YlxW (UPF0749 family)